MNIHVGAPEGYKRLGSGLMIPDGAMKGLGTYTGKIIRKGLIIDEFEIENLVVNQGLNYALNAALGGGSQLTSWYLGLFSGNYTVLNTDTASTIAANSTEVTAYTAGARVVWTPASASGQAISNSGSTATFTFNGSVTVYGAFLVSNNTINGTSGSLFSGAQFGSAKSVISGDQLVLTYTYTLASA